MPGGMLRFLDHIKNEDSPGPPIGSHHAFFSDDQEPYPVTDIADLIRDSYEVMGPIPHLLRGACWGDGRQGGFQAASVSSVHRGSLSGPSPCRSLEASLWSRLSVCAAGTASGYSRATKTPRSRTW